MKSSIDNFIRLLTEGDFFLIFLIVIMLVVVSVIIYLIKLQVNENSLPEENIEKYIDEELEKEETKEVKEEIKPGNINQTKFDFEKEKIVDSKPKKNLEEIKSYETDQEEMAIISASELDNRIKTMKENGEYDKHLEEIDNYEAEEENKAIISYDELLKRATTNTISYESEENLGGIKVGKVDTSKIEISDGEMNRPYYKEETFLRALKDFRGNL